MNETMLEAFWMPVDIQVHVRFIDILISTYVSRRTIEEQKTYKLPPIPENPV